jgi:mannose-1-phosphate guanylyltransferase
MRERANTWAVVLAAGDGTRLATLTTDSSGRAVPKQFCSLTGGGSLLHDALQRASHIVPQNRVCAIVASQHRRFWQRELARLPQENVIVQPINRGTANGVLLAVLSVLARDPHAHIVFLPADHYVRDEEALARSLRDAVTLLRRNSHVLMLLGIQPEEADPELGYIIPCEVLDDGARGVRRFVEKPPAGLARDLLSAGALWNSFIFAAAGSALLDVLRTKMRSTVDEMYAALGSAALQGLYERLPDVDFSRAIIQGSEHMLRVLATPACGWSDLGTPKRVAETLRRIAATRLEQAIAPGASSFFHAPAFINLATQQALRGLVS